MSLNLVNLDDRTRQYMLRELEYDLKHANLYLSPRLSPKGKSEYMALLRHAILKGTDATLARDLCSEGRMNTYEPKRLTSGRTTTVAVPDNAPSILAEGEFNRYYIRGLCSRAIEDSVPRIVVYRAKIVNRSRAESTARIGTELEPAALLNDLRANPGVDTALGVPAGPNSGLSVRIP